MDKFSSLIIPSDFSNFSGRQTLYKYLHSKIFIIIGMPISAYYSIYYLNRSSYLIGGILAVMFLLLCCYLYIFMKKSEVRKPDLLQEVIIRLFLLFFILSQLYDLWIEQSLHTTPWFFIFPVLIYLIKRGISIIVGQAWTQGAS